MSKTRIDLACPAAKVVLQEEKEKVRAVCVDASGFGIISRQPDTVMIGRVDTVASIPLLVHPHENNIVGRGKLAPQLDRCLDRRDRDVKLQALLAGVDVLRLGGEPRQGREVDGVAPLRGYLRLVGVALEVVRQENVRVVRDVFVAGIARCDTDVCWRYRWSEKCDYSRKSDEPDTSEFCEPHECVCAAKSAPQRVATDTIVAFLFSAIRRTGLVEKTGYTLGASGFAARRNQSLFSSPSVLASTVQARGAGKPHGERTEFVDAAPPI